MELLSCSSLAGSYRPDNAQKFFKLGARVKIPSAVLIAAYGGMFIIWALTYWRRSKVMFEEMVKLGYFPITYYSPLRIDTRVVLGFVTIHAVSCLVAIFFVIAM